MSAFWKKTVVKQIKECIGGMRKRVRWWLDTRKIRRQMRMIPLERIPQGQLMVLAPHADDEWVGCAQLLNRYAAHSVVVNMNQQGGDDPQMHETRRKEMEHAAMQGSYRLVSGDLAQLLAIEKPKCVWLPFWVDWHEEHIAVMRIFSDAAERAEYSGLVGMYQVSVPIPAGMITAAEPMNRSQLRNKWKKLRQFYPTQSHLPVARFAANERINGVLAGSYAAECYAILSFASWREAFLRFVPDTAQRSRLRREINQLARIRVQTESLLQDAHDRRGVPARKGHWEGMEG